MKSYLDILASVKEVGQDRDTRSGMCRSVFDWNGSIDLGNQILPLLTVKKMALRQVVGELLWFLSGKSTISSLKHYTFGDESADKWTIWTDDQNRWRDSLAYDYMVKHTMMDEDSCGMNYGVQWRGSDGGVDQIDNLIANLKDDPYSRRLIVQAYNPNEVDLTCLPPCHTGFQCYVRDGKDGEKILDLKWTQRSCDLFLGFPFNLASYGILLHILAKLTGMKAGRLSWTVGDVHIYHKHFEAVDTVLLRAPRIMPTISLPNFESLDDLVNNFTAEDFLNMAVDYDPYPAVKAELQVG